MMPATEERWARKRVLGSERRTGPRLDARATAEFAAGSAGFAGTRACAQIGDPGRSVFEETWKLQIPALGPFCATMNSSRLRWGLWGALFGLCFPLMALGIRWAQTGSAGAWVALTTDPLLWIIVTAPLFLGVFAALGGHQHDGLRGLTAELEDRVKERTADLVSAVDRLRLITDNVADGLLTIDLDGRLVGPASAQAVRWFGEPTDRSGLAEWLKADDPTFGDLLAMGLDQIREDILPVELTLEQLPRQFQSGDRQYEFDARVIPGGRELLLVIRDATDRLALARERAASEERHAVIAQMLRDPGGFQLFRTDCEHLLEEARETDSEATCKKALHTLKGNSAVYGFCRLASVCHQIEDELQDSGAPLLDEEQGKRLQETYADSIQQVAAFLPDEADVVRVSREELLRLADSGGVSEHIRKTLERWTHEPLQPILDRLVSHGERVAERLGKQVDFVAEAGDARVNLDAHGEFIAQLCHVVRNRPWGRVTRCPPRGEQAEAGDGPPPGNRQRRGDAAERRG